IVIVAALIGLFLLLLVGAFIRSRQAAAVFREAAAGKVPRPEPKPTREAKRPSPVSRRDFFRRSLLASIGLFSAEFGLASIAFVWPNLRGGFGAVIDLGLSPDAIKQQIDADNQPFYYGAGRFYLVNYDGDSADTLYQGLVGDGLMALYQKCVHLGCRVPFCTQSQWFECPCHGSKYNRAGEYRDGPAPRSMDRFRVIVQDGLVSVDTGTRIDGPPRGTDTTQQQPEGPFCVTIGGE
ncbi:MAG: ubiquinol-cytochrome c reductase iron-sulfur subunit, partial [Actinomycetota bacterium]